MSLTRRSFLASAAAGLAVGAPAKRFDGFYIGVTDWNLQQTGKLEAVTLAKSLGFDGVQVSLGRKPVEKLPLNDPGVQEQYPTDEVEPWWDTFDVVEELSDP